MHNAEGLWHFNNSILTNSIWRSFYLLECRFETNSQSCPTAMRAFCFTTEAAKAIHLRSYCAAVHRLHVHYLRENINLPPMQYSKLSSCKVGVVLGEHKFPNGENKFSRMQQLNDPTNGKCIAFPSSSIHR